MLAFGPLWAMVQKLVQVTLVVSRLRPYVSDASLLNQEYFCQLPLKTVCKMNTSLNCRTRGASSLPGDQVGSPTEKPSQMSFRKDGHQVTSNRMLELKWLSEPRGHRATVHAALQTCGETLQGHRHGLHSIWPIPSTGYLGRRHAYAQDSHTRMCTLPIHVCMCTHISHTHTRYLRLGRRWLEDTLSPCRYRSQKSTRIDKVALGGLR